MKKEDKGISRRSFLKAASSVGISAVSTTPFSEAHASPLRAPSAEYGREKIARIIHRLTALLFLIMAIPFVAVQLAHIRNWAIWPENSWSPVAFFDGIKGLWINYISLGHVRIGKFNVGQKLFAWTMIVAITAITASGFVLMFRDLFTQGIQEFCCFAHAASFVVIGVFLIVHL